MNKMRAFTLIELLVVISIISLLSSVVLSSLQSARNKARAANLKTQMEQVEKASNLYFSNTGNYAADVSSGVSPAFVPTYLGVWPKGSSICPGYSYDWENWLNYGEGYMGLRTSLRGPDGDVKAYWCIKDLSDNCSWGGTGNPDGIAYEVRDISSFSCN